MVNFNFDLDADDVEDAINDAPQIGGAGVNYQIGMDTAVNSVLGSQHDRLVNIDYTVFVKTWSIYINFHYVTFDEKP